MSTIPKMLEMVQPCDGRDLATLTQFGRVLREAGYLPSGKRGKGASQMSLDHTVNLLLGTYGAASPKDGPRTVSGIRSLIPYGIDGSMHESCAVLDGVKNAATFGEAMEELLAGLPELIDYLMNFMPGIGAMTDETKATWREATSMGSGMFDVKVSISLRVATITVMQATRTMWEASFIINADLVKDGQYLDVLNADRRPSTEFTFRTLSTFYIAMDGAI